MTDSEHFMKTPVCNSESYDSKFSIAFNRECSLHSKGYIYRITHLPTGKTYIGQHFPRPDEDFYQYMGSGLLIRRALIIYPFGDFSKEILVSASTSAELDTLEKIYIAEERSKGRSEYNIADGGAGIGSEALKALWTDDLREKQSTLIKKLWENDSYRLAMIESHNNFWANEVNRKTRSDLMKKKWKNSSYAKSQRTKLKNPKVLEAISEGNKATKRAKREEISKKTTSQWHRQNHSSLARRTCFKCNEEKRSVPLSQIEVEEVLRSTSNRKIAIDLGLTLNEVVMLRRKNK